MAITDTMRKAFDECTVMAGVEPDFECVFITKDAALSYLDEIDAENAKLRELCVKALEWLRWAGGITCPPEVPDEFADELRELGVEVDG